MDKFPNPNGVISCMVKIIRDSLSSWQFVVYTYVLPRIAQHFYLSTFFVPHLLRLMSVGARIRNGNVSLKCDRAK